jgi:antitoxin (DNA-binding transcriptional repressor) of toxin-antitoxin stability system
MGMTLSIRDARTCLTRVDELLEANREIIITRRGKPIAKVVPLDFAGKREVPSHADLRARTSRLPTPTEVLVREDRDAR